MTRIVRINKSSSIDINHNEETGNEINRKLLRTVPPNNDLTPFTLFSRYIFRPRFGLMKNISKSLLGRDISKIYRIIINLEKAYYQYKSKYLLRIVN